MKTQMSLIVCIALSLSLSHASAQEGQCHDGECKLPQVNALQTEKKDIKSHTAPTTLDDIFNTPLDTDGDSDADKMLDQEVVDIADKTYLEVVPLPPPGVVNIGSGKTCYPMASGNMWPDAEITPTGAWTYKNSGGSGGGLDVSLEDCLAKCRCMNVENYFEPTRITSDTVIDSSRWGVLGQVAFGDSPSEECSGVLGDWTFTKQKSCYYVSYKENECHMFSGCGLSGTGGVEDAVGFTSYSVSPPPTDLPSDVTEIHPEHYSDCVSQPPTRTTKCGTSCSIRGTSFLGSPSREVSLADCFQLCRDIADCAFVSSKRLESMQIQYDIGGSNYFRYVGECRMFQSITDGNANPNCIYQYDSTDGEYWEWKSYAVR